GQEVLSEHQFCPGCGQSMATEKNCVSCQKQIPINFAYCPHCGDAQT
ncbi:MAG: zinc ribbon domain-containing protein, partial [Anaerolineales bacterium]|nr:zinc ribbon domain-containing protein [Anaerolineales bacterium]